MIEVHDYSYLKPEEAREKIIHLAHRIFAEQFHENFFVKDPRPEYYLKYEIHAFFEGRIEEIHGFSNFFGQIVSPITSYVWSTVQSWIRWLSSVVSGYVTSARNYVVNSLRWWIESACNYALSAYNSITTVYSYLRGTVSYYLSSIQSALSGLWNTVHSAVRSSINIVWNWLIQVWNDYIKPGVSAIVSGFKWLWERAANFAQSAFEWAKNAYNMVKDVWNGIVEEVSGKFEAITQQVAALPQAIASGFQSAISYLKDILTGFWNDVLVPFGETIREKIVMGAEWFINAVGGIFDNILSTLARYAPTTPERAWSLVKVVVPVAIAATVAPYYVTTLAELAHPLKRIGLTDIATKLHETLGLGTIGSFALGAVVGSAIKTPLNYYVNAIFRPNLPSFGDVHNLLGRYSISESEFKQFMRWYGINENYYWMYAELGTSPSPTMTLRYYARYVGLNPDEVAEIMSKLQSPKGLDVRTETNWFLRELLRMGRSPEWMRAFTQLCLVESTRIVRDQYAREILKDYEYGYITKDELESELRAVGYPEQQRKLLLQFAEVRADRRDVDEHVKALQYSYRRGKITIDEFRAGLASLGIREDKIQRLVAIELARAKEEVGSTQEEEVRATGRGTAIKRFREGLITEAELEAELRMLGYSPAWIERLKIIARLERDYDFAMTVLRYVKTAYRKKKIDDTRFIEILRSYGFTDEKILLELDLLKLAYGLGLEEEEVAS